MKITREKISYEHRTTSKSENTKKYRQKLARKKVKKMSNEKKRIEKMGNMWEKLNHKKTEARQTSGKRTCIK